MSEAAKVSRIRGASHLKIFVLSGTLGLASSSFSSKDLENGRCKVRKSRNVPGSGIGSGMGVLPVAGGAEHGESGAEVGWRQAGSERNLASPQYCELRSGSSYGSSSHG